MGAVAVKDEVQEEGEQQVEQSLNNQKESDHVVVLQFSVVKGISIGADSKGRARESVRGEKSGEHEGRVQRKPEQEHQEVGDKEVEHNEHHIGIIEEMRKNQSYKLSKTHISESAENRKQDEARFTNALIVHDGIVNTEQQKQEEVDESEEGEISHQS